MGSRFGNDDIFACACGREFIDKRGLSAHIRQAKHGVHFPTSSNS